MFVTIGLTRSAVFHTGVDVDAFLVVCSIHILVLSVVALDHNDTGVFDSRTQVGTGRRRELHSGGQWRIRLRHVLRNQGFRLLRRTVDRRQTDGIRAAIAQIGVAELNLELVVEGVGGRGGRCGDVVAGNRVGHVVDGDVEDVVDGGRVEEYLRVGVGCVTHHVHIWQGIAMRTWSWWSWLTPGKAFG